MLLLFFIASIVSIVDISLPNSVRRFSFFVNIFIPRF
jgi:hypothetical protein